MGVGFQAIKLFDPIPTLALCSASSVPLPLKREEIRTLC